jgi:hypothetical protein
VNSPSPSPPRFAHRNQINTALCMNSNNNVCNVVVDVEFKVASLPLSKVPLKDYQLLMFEATLF